MYTKAVYFKAFPFSFLFELRRMRRVYVNLLYYIFVIRSLKVEEIFIRKFKVRKIQSVHIAELELESVEVIEMWILYN